MKKLIILLVVILLPQFCLGLSGRQILRLIDRNQKVYSSYFKGTMVIKKRNKKLTKAFYGYGKRADEKFLMVFTNTEDRGVKYLKTKKNLWIYFPDADDIQRISGHMLRRSMMGSDISYEDLLSYDDFEKKYRAALKGTKVINGRNCYVIEIIAKVRDVPYYKQKVYVDTTRFVALRSEMYTKSGRMLKTMEQYKIRMVSGRYLAFEIKMKDMRRKDSVTIIRYSQLRLNVPLKRGLFSKRNLSR